MDNHDIAEAAGLTWHYLDSETQQTRTHHYDRELNADVADLYNEDGELMLSLRRIAETPTERGCVPAFWVPVHSELLSSEALNRLAPVASPEHLDLGQLLDIETEDARWMPDHHRTA
jgi:hypothetical protein